MLWSCKNLDFSFISVFYTPSAKRKFSGVYWNHPLSHNNPCFPCNIAITNFLILYTCEIRFYDIIDRTVHTLTSLRHPTQKFQNMAKWVCFGPLFFNLIRLIQWCDKKNLTFVDCWDKIILNSSWKMLLSLPKPRLITFSKTCLI